MKPSHTLDPRRLDALREIKDARMGELQKRGEQVRLLIDRREASKETLRRLWQDCPPGLRKDPQIVSKAKSLDDDIAGIEADLRISRARQEKLSEDSNAAGQLYERCAEFMEGR